MRHFFLTLLILLLMSCEATYESSEEKKLNKVVVSDIENFWTAYDLVNTTNETAHEIYKEHYFDKGSQGLKDYFSLKIKSIDKFVENLDSKKRFYASIRSTTLEITEKASQIEEILEEFKRIYPDAVIPNVYFVIGRFNSGGTASENGLLVSIDMNAKSQMAELDELNLWETNNIKPIDDVHYLVAHEMVHYLQDITYQKNLLSIAVAEGMADFIGELVSGETANPRLHQFAKGKELMIWEQFKKDMFQDKASEWVANSEQETKERPADLGYWVGYQLVKSYYDNSTDKQAAIKNLLHLEDYESFLKIADFDNKVRQF